MARTALRAPTARSTARAAARSSRGSRGNHRRAVAAALVGPEAAGALDALALAQQAAEHGVHHAALPSLAEGIGPQCALYDCGDMTYRSTLDLELRKELGGLTLQGKAIIGGVGLYLLATPGVLWGFIDTYIVRLLQRALSPAYRLRDFELGQRLGKGAFGEVFRATCLREGASEDQVVLKRADDYGAEEVWMNGRVSRLPVSKNFARYLGAFRETGRDGSEQTWLAWRYEGDFTLSTYMRRKDFPECLEVSLLGESLEGESKARRRSAVVRELMRQLFEALDTLHSVGIVHRDIKPQNIIISGGDGVPGAARLKIIDLGAAADLRVGINYAPNEFLLDPRYAPPEQYIMSTLTPEPPPPAIAAALSPILWTLERPDRFDMYCAGVTFAQLAFPNLASDNALIKWNKIIKSYDYNLDRWRRAVRDGTEVRRSGRAREYAEGLEMLDVDDGEGYALLRRLITAREDLRLDASGARSHPYLSNNPLLLPLQALQRKYRGFRAGGGMDSESEALATFLSKAGTSQGGGFTEADLEYFEEAGSLPSARSGLAATIARKAIKATGKYVKGEDPLKQATLLDGVMDRVMRAFGK